jgi:hypothetical protein
MGTVQHIEIGGVINSPEQLADITPDGFGKRRLNGFRRR